MPECITCRGRSAADAQGANCGAPERRSLDLRRRHRHFIAESEKCPALPAYGRTKEPENTFHPVENVLIRTKMNFDPFYPAEIVLTRTNRCLTSKNSVTRKKSLSPAKNHPKKLARQQEACRPKCPDNPPRYQNSRIREATSSSSHFGVDVAPQTPARSSLRNHSGRTSAGLVT